MQIWSGAGSLQTVGTSASTCANWSAGTNGYAGISGMTILSEAFGTMPRSCTQTTPPVRVYCLQE
jgi:hypothetical protein